MGHGDSGGPVFMQQHGMWKLAGLANHTLYKTDPATTQSTELKRPTQISAAGLI